MVLIRALLFLFLNIGLGYLLVICLRAALLSPIRKKYLFSWHIPITPGLIYQIKERLADYIHSILNDFLRDCENIDIDSRISQIEQQIYHKVLDRIDSLKLSSRIPRWIAKNLRDLTAQIAFELTRHVVRTFIPYLLEKYDVEQYISILEQRADISILKGYYNRYFHRFLLYFSLSFFFMTGIFNMLIYLIIR
jgi:uncharacterized membrane protein YheB (UPF0754 family)